MVIVPEPDGVMASILGPAAIDWAREGENWLAVTTFIVTGCRLLRIEYEKKNSARLAREPRPRDARAPSSCVAVRPDPGARRVRAAAGDRHHRSSPPRRRRMSSLLELAVTRVAPPRRRRSSPASLTLTGSNQ